MQASVCVLSLACCCSDNNLPYRDTNGFRKLIVVLTAPGKVFGLHSGDGRILWASNTAAAPPDSGTGDSRQYLKLWRRFHDLTHAPQVAVLSTGAQQSAVHVLNAHTGQQLKSTELPYGVEKVCSKALTAGHWFLTSHLLTSRASVSVSMDWTLLDIILQGMHARGTAVGCATLGPLSGSCLQDQKSACCSF